MPSRWCTTMSGRRSPGRSSHWGPAPPCWSIPTTSRGRCGPRSRWRALGLGAVRIDSGDLAEVARAVRAQLDLLGAPPAPGSWSPATWTSTPSPPSPRPRSTAMASAPRSSPARACRPQRSSTSSWPERAEPAGRFRPVAKQSVGKPTIGGRKWAVRTLTETGTAAAEVISAVASGRGRRRAGRAPRPAAPAGTGRGNRLGRAHRGGRDRRRRTLAELPHEALRLSHGEPAIPTIFPSAMSGPDDSGPGRSSARQRQPPGASRAVAFLPCMQAHVMSLRPCDR